MDKYLICIPTDDVWNAASKARDDIEELAVENGFQRMIFAGDRTSDGSLFGMLNLLKMTLKNWKMVQKQVSNDAIVLIQYPHYPLKTALLTRWLIPSIRRRKKVRFVALVHDLNSVRGTFGWVAKYSDEKLLHQFDMIICHNDSMKGYLAQNGINEEKLISLGLFDYRTEAALQEHRLSDGIALAGNLSPEKCGYIQDMLSALDGKLPVHLYGNGFDEESSYSSVIHHGAFPPEVLPGVIEGAFGLVWDGKSVDTCSGKYGEYLKINNPHKVSLYLASGIPVIIWRDAALADYITENGLGIAVDSICEIPAKLSSVSESDYMSFCENVQKEAKRIRSGYFFSESIDNLLSNLSLLEEK